ncbi:hypothetical protein scyTo_0018509 [Scyliorhinus torazame]|uniref:Syntaxin 6/10/61 N-terminal domain-containing protein n=1 Tax=Scyliorhinus torazame TaxID=75743 RepID=A0A401PXA7_SCYTO|nr:hypothetical protein [Scyliorhinus torazame]
MSVEDPFFVVKGEVQKAVNTARGLYQRWCELLQDTQTVSKEEYDWTTNELRNSLRSIEWDLEDLDETIDILQQNCLYRGLLAVSVCSSRSLFTLNYCKRIVESNPRKFKIETNELQERKAFVVKTRHTVKEMKDHISSPSAVAFGERTRQSLLGGTERQQHQPMDRYKRLDQELENTNSLYIEEQQAQQRVSPQTGDTHSGS